MVPALSPSPTASAAGDGAEELSAFVSVLESLDARNAETEANAFVRAELRAIAAEHGVPFGEIRRLWAGLLDDCIVRAMHEGTAEADEPSGNANEIGGSFAKQGFTLSVSLEIVMALRRTAMEALRRQCDEDGRSARFVALGMRHLARSMGQDMVGINEGHLEAELAGRTQRQHERDAFVWQALTGDHTGRAFSRLDLYGLDAAVPYAAFRAHPRTEDEMERLLARLEPTGLGAYRLGAATLVDGDLCGFASDAAFAGTTDTLGVSDPVLFTDLPSAFRRASRAFDVATRLRLDGAHSIESLGLVAAVVSDQDIAEILRREYLDPLHRLDDYGDTLLETIRSFIGCDAQLDATARALDLHVNTVRYRLSKFEEMLGRSLRDTEVLAEVWWTLNLPRS